MRRIARLSRRALDEALAEVDWRSSDAPSIDLRADAYGHGAIEVEAAARAHGASRFWRDGDGEPHGDGVEIYGVDGRRPPIMSLEGEVVAIKRVAAETAVSYGYTYVTTDDATLALVALGYADGVPRSASNRGTVRIGETRGVVAGRIAMDQLVVDLGAASAEVGDTAVLWDDAESLSVWRTTTGRTGVELTARLGPRISRVWSDE